MRHNSSRAFHSAISRPPLVSCHPMILLGSRRKHIVGIFKVLFGHSIPFTDCRHITTHPYSENKVSRVATIHPGLSHKRLEVACHGVPHPYRIFPAR